MRITSELICQAADQLHGFVGLNRKTGQYIVRFSEDSFGMDVADDGIIPEVLAAGSCRDIALTDVDAVNLDARLARR